MSDSTSATTASVTASLQQARASRPDASAWVSANAGSGKTYVLVNRIIRLMLAGAAPERILCLTFTRAAAAEMEARLFRRLSAWIILDDDELRKAIAALDPAGSWDGNLAVARRLFTRALETPGGLKIQTLHGFCESVLQRFPVEAGVAPGFKVMDPLASKDLMRDVREQVLERAARKIAGSPESEALRQIVVHTQAAGFDDVLTTLLDERSELIAGWSKQDKRDAAWALLLAELELEEGDTAETIVEAALEAIDEAAAGAIMAACSASKSKTDQKRASNLATALEQGDWDLYAAVFLTAKGEPRAESGLLTKPLKEQHPSLWDWMLDEQVRVAKAEDQRKSALTAEASDALFTLASVILRRFEKEKERRGQLDYDDLVIHTRNLLTRLDAGWVLYRLDGGIDHVLIDEAQDTSPEQWEIVAQLTGDFFSGEAARERRRTVFAVGDHKQSIFSFQGADPDEFIAQKSELSKRVAASGQAFEDVRVNVSFRSTQTVLDAVDEVFRDPVAQKGMADDEISHQANRLGQAGLVELWPVVEPAEKEERDPYDPVDAPPASDPRLRLARHIAGAISDWLKNGEMLKPRGRAVEPGDILILVRNRTVLADAIVRGLRQAGIPVAGADRLKINSHIAVMDLVALARFAHMPQDDYSLACVLKSPLVRRDDGAPLDDEDLMALAPEREGTLWQALQTAAGYEEAKASLRAWRMLARYARPFEFFSQVLETGGARNRFAARLGPEANDPLDEMLTLAVEFERSNPPVLHGFISWLTEADAEIKRDMDHGKNEVRVMTVHGAKGLESNIVILPDTTRSPDARKVPPILKFDSGSPVWKLSAAAQPSKVSALVAADIDSQCEEENRLLYVAMTRARDRLYVGGAKSTSALAVNCWYELVRRAIEVDAREVGGGVWQLEGAQTAPVARGEEASAQAPVVPSQAGWMLQPAPPEPPEPRPLAPSRLELMRGDNGVDIVLKDQSAASPIALIDENRFLRGRLIHRLLQNLPDLPDDQRDAAAGRFLESHGASLDEAGRQGVIDEVFALLRDPDPALQAAFGPAGLPEVPITAKLQLSGPDGRPIVISGQVDRLAITDDEVIVIDFKTNRPPPHDIADVAQTYIRQLAAYSLALQTIYPGKQIRAWLVWTFDATIMEVPGDMLSGAFT